MAGKKKTSTRKPKTMGGDEMNQDQYFLRGGQAYVRSAQSGDVVAGPFPKGTAAYNKAVRDSMTGRTVEFGSRSMLEGMRNFRGGGGFRQHGR